MLQCFFNAVLLTICISTSIHFLWTKDSLNTFLSSKLKFRRIFQELKLWFQSLKTLEINKDNKSPFSHSLKDLSTQENGHFGTSSEIRWIHPNTVSRYFRNSFPRKISNFFQGFAIYKTKSYI